MKVAALLGSGPSHLVSELRGLGWELRPYSEQTSGEGPFVVLVHLDPQLLQDLSWYSKLQERRPHLGVLVVGARELLERFASVVKDPLHLLHELPISPTTLALALGNSRAIAAERRRGRRAGVDMARAPAPREAPDTIYNLKQLEDIAIRRAIAATGGCLSRAAKLLGIGRATLYRRLSARPTLIRESLHLPRGNEQFPSSEAYEQGSAE